MAVCLTSIGGFGLPVPIPDSVTVKVPVLSLFTDLFMDLVTVAIPVLGVLPDAFSVSHSILLLMSLGGGADPLAGGVK